MKIAFLTLGCKANQYDTQAMETMALEAGHTLTAFSSPDWEIGVINTCTVTSVSDKKSRQMIRRARREHPDAVIGVCGCFSQMSPSLSAELGADVVGGSAGRRSFFDALLQCAATRGAACTVEKHVWGEAFEELPAGGLHARTRAMLKIQEGCDNYCTYCIIPYSRGHIRSLPPEDAVLRTRELRNAGYAECVLTGIEISSYGRDLPGKPALTDLLEMLSEAAGPMRLHLGSLEPRTIDEDFCRRISALSNICPHFHPALQAGCDSVLAAMRRKYTTARFLESVELLRRFFPGCMITTDMITGFPGETDEDFAETLSFIQKCRFGQMHIFPYSVREGTPAAKMTQVPMVIREKRAAEASAVAQKMEQDYLAAQIGRILPFLPETCEDGIWRGHTDNYAELRTTAQCERGVTVPMRVTETDGTCLTGIPCK